MDEKYKKYCHEGAHPDIIVNNNRNLTTHQYKEALKRLRIFIESENLFCDDDTTLGNKSTTCNWGICTDSNGVWNSAELHTFPKDFDDYGRISAIEPPEGYDCPMREGKDLSGCFYQCRVFNRRKKTPTREEALLLVDNMIDQLESDDE